MYADTQQACMEVLREHGAQGARYISDIDIEVMRKVYKASSGPSRSITRSSNKHRTPDSKRTADWSNGGAFDQGLPTRAFNQSIVRLSLMNEIKVTRRQCCR